MLLLVGVLVKGRQRRPEVGRVPIPGQQKFCLAGVGLIAELRLLLDGRERVGRGVFVVGTLVVAIFGVVFHRGLVVVPRPILQCQGEAFQTDNIGCRVTRFGKKAPP